MNCNHVCQNPDFTNFNDVQLSNTSFSPRSGKEAIPHEHNFECQQCCSPEEHKKVVKDVLLSRSTCHDPLQATRICRSRNIGSQTRENYMLRVLPITKGHLSTVLLEIFILEPCFSPCNAFPSALAQPCKQRRDGLLVREYPALHSNDAVSDNVMQEDSFPDEIFSKAKYVEPVASSSLNVDLWTLFLKLRRTMKNDHYISAIGSNDEGTTNENPHLSSLVESKSFLESARPSELFSDRTNVVVQKYVKEVEDILEFYQLLSILYAMLQKYSY